MTPGISSSGRETLRLGPPATGTIVVSVDARRSSSPFTAAVQTLLPGGELPVHRCRDWDQVWVVLKGQGRVTLGDGVSTTVVHGAVLSLPRQTWFGLRNTGNGPLEAVVVSAPAGIDGFFRELAQLGQAPDQAAIQQVAQRYGIEIRPSASTEVAQPSGHGRKRHRRGGRGRGRHRAIQPQALPAPQPLQSAAPMAPLPQGAGAVTQPPPVPGEPGRRRRRRGGRGRGRSKPPGAQAQPSTASPLQAQAQKPKPQPPKPQPSGSRGSQDRGGRHRSRHMKEVYMGGKWVQVSGEGPVIASIESAQARRGRHHQVDDDGPGGPLSVPL